MEKIKSAFAVVLCIIIALAFSGCKEEHTEINVTEITEKIKSVSNQSIKWEELSGYSIERYFGFTPTSLNTFSVYIDVDDEKYNIISAFEFADEKSLVKGIEQANKAMVASADNFKLINSTESEKINKRLFLHNGNVLVIVILDDVTKAKEYLSDLKFTTIS